MKHDNDYHAGFNFGPYGSGIELHYSDGRVTIQQGGSMVDIHPNNLRLLAFSLAELVPHAEAYLATRSSHA